MASPLEQVTEIVQELQNERDALLEAAEAAKLYLEEPEADAPSYWAALGKINEALRLAGAL